MKFLKGTIWGHVILFLPAAAICAHDWTHPELWDDWSCNPYFVIPCMTIMECWIWGVALWWALREEPKRKRMAEGMRKLQEAHRLLDAGKLAEADEAYREGKRLTGV